MISDLDGAIINLDTKDLDQYLHETKSCLYWTNNKSSKFIIEFKV